MTFEEIIRSFARSETVPDEAVRAALDAPVAFVDKAVSLVERVAAGMASEDEGLAFCVLVHVLADIGDERAFFPLMRVLSLSPEELDRLLGDCLTQTMGNVLIALSSDHSSVLEAALADISIEDFARDAIFKAWTHQVLIGRVSREKAKAFLADYPVRVGLDTIDYGWSSWVDSVTILGLAETTEFAREHLPDDTDIDALMEGPEVTYQDFKEELSDTMANPERWRLDRSYQPFSDTIGELSQWHSYSEEFREEGARTDAWEYDEEDDQGLRTGLDLYAPFIASNPYRDVGRNDPCPCGSGKKFKKCCLALTE